MKKNPKLIFLIVLLSVSNAFLFAGNVYKEKALVSYYAEDFHGKKTSNGEYFDMNKLTCASKNLPFDTELKVTNLSNGKSVVVRVNDRGPFVVDRELDLSKAAAVKLDMIKSGTAYVRIEIIKMGQDTKLSQQTAASAVKIMEKLTGKKYTPPAVSKVIMPSQLDLSRYYDFQMGAFSSKKNAYTLASKLNKDGFKNITYQTLSTGIVRVILKEVHGAEVESLKRKLLDKGYLEFQVKERVK